MPPDLDFDPFDAERTHDMWALMAELRRQAPVARISGGFAYVSRYDDARSVLRDELVFSNAGGMRPTGLEVPLHDSSVGELVPPIHPPVRRLAFSAAQGGGVVERLRSTARRISERLLDRVEARGRGELIADLSLPLTTRVIGALLGVEEKDCDRLARWGEEIMRSPLTVTNETERGVGYEGAFPEFTAFLDGLIATRRAIDPGAARAPGEPEDTITRIVRTGLEIAPLDTRLIRMILLNLVLGGTATTRDFIGNFLVELLGDRTLHERLAADRSLVRVALEESLRHKPPVLYLIRTCTEPIELAGRRLEAGERIVVGIASANRDEAIYVQPDRFSIDRAEPAPHLSFGYGKHFCVGAALARMEAEEAANAFLDRFAPGSIGFAEHFRHEWMPLPYMLGPLRIDVEKIEP